MNMKQIISTLTAGLLSAVLLAGCTVFVDGDAVTSMDLVDEEGVTLSSVSDWTPGESRTFHLDELPEGCEVNVVSSDRELMTADYADNAITLTAVESGHAIVTVEVSMTASKPVQPTWDRSRNAPSLSKSYEIQITARHMQAGMTLIDSRAIQPENALESAFHPERENFGSATFASGYLELQAGNQATILFTGFDVTDGEPKPLETPVTVRSSENEVTFDGTYYLSEDRVILQCPRAGQYTLDLVLSCEGYADLPVQIQISVSEPSQSIALSAKGFDAYAPTVEVGSSIILDAETVSEDTVLTVTADNSIVTATVGEDKRITITAVEEGTGSVTIHASTPGYQDAELTLQVHSVPELISMTILGDRLERNNVVHLAEGEIVELTVLNPSEGDLSHEIDDPAIVSAVQKSNKLELEGLAAGETTITLTCQRNGYSTNTKTLTIIVTEA